jgi:hypothetical protein
MGWHKSSPPDAISSYHLSKIGTVPLARPRGGDPSFEGSMVIKFMQTPDGSDDSIRFQLIERLKVYSFGVIVLFASFGMGETVYRLLFSVFDGAKDRIPIEAVFGFAFAWLATKFVGDVYRNRKETSSRSESSAKRWTGLSGR